MKTVQLEITHLPSCKTWTGITASTEDEYRRFAKHIVHNQLESLMLITEHDGVTCEHHFSERILKDCVATIVSTEKG